MKIHQPNILGHTLLSIKLRCYLVPNLITQRRNKRAEEGACCKMTAVRCAKIALAAAGSLMGAQTRATETACNTTAGRKKDPAKFGEGSSVRADGLCIGCPK